MQKNAPIQGRFTDALKERGMSINESMAKDNSIMITALPKMTKPLLPLDKYGNRLNYLNPNTTQQS
jgi:hypothetical protein